MTNWTPLYFQEVLDKNRLEILKNLKSFKEMGFVLWGGTGLALIFWHRESIDFDFFIENEIDTEKLFQKCLDVFIGFDVIKTYEEKNTLYILANGVKISFFTYKYKNIGNILKTEYFNIFSLEDIWAMKLWAIQNRATNKDYIDLYYIIKNVWLDPLLKNFFDKFWNVVTQSYILKSLIYFEDIVDESLILKDSNLSFNIVMNFLNDIVIKKP